MMLWVLAPCLVSTGAQAQAQERNEAPNVTVERTEDRAVQLGRKIRCPVCQGMPISESPSRSAQDMMTQLRRLVAEGKTDQEIVDWFQLRYGEWAILEPSTSGFNLLVWLLPVFALIIGLVLFVRVQSLGSSSLVSTEDAKLAEEESPYLKALRDEVDS